MTPERRKYIESISNEERAIRNAIDHLKIFIRNDKDGLKNGIDATIDGLKWDIRNCKYVIKALKKQLPAPILAGETCSVCDFSHEDSLIFPSYCTCCGQKLR